MSKIFNADDYFTIVAESEEEAKELYFNELEGTEEDWKGNELNPDTHFCVNEFGNKHTLRKAMEKHNQYTPYILCVSSSLL